jgi:hypothetical protein
MVIQYFYDKLLILATVLVMSSVMSAALVTSGSYEHFKRSLCQKLFQKKIFFFRLVLDFRFFYLCSCTLQSQHFITKIKPKHTANS